MNRQLYKQQVEYLHTRTGFEEDTKQMLSSLLVCQSKETKMKTINKKLTILIVAAAFALLLTTTVFAASMLLSPSDLALRIGDSSLAEAFNSEDAVIVNESITAGEYTITYLGMVNMENLTQASDGDEAYTYAAFSIEYIDGREIPIENGCPISITPLVDGYQPWCVNFFSLSNGAHGYVENGAYYYLLCCNSLDLFADHRVAIYIYDGFAPSSEIFSYDNESGAIGYNDSYTGIRGIFELDLDESKADPQAAQELLESVGFEFNEDGSLKLE